MFADEELEKREQVETRNAEIQARADAAIAPDGDRDTTDPQAQFGRVMSRFEIERKLKLLNPMLFFEVSKACPWQLGIYITDGISNLDSRDPHYCGVRFLCGMENGESPEFSIRKVKKEFYYNESSQKVEQRDVFAGEVMGWRTVLARLIRAKIIQPEAAIREFQVTQSLTQSQNWQNLVN
jgi:hypothetical protein